ncbi:protein of unknown function [Legionella fallonii LLAP-10]|uniref:Transposase n=1 Tax=Legionella fallonii LLAP-10 TaxID=1212491 RepID=A0A098G8Q3_9GAMM|nr:protein of unknown function [Legionella fallonii LLAP-10]
MKKSKFTDSQILSILKQAEGGTSVSVICWEHVIGAATFCKRVYRIYRELELNMWIKTQKRLIREKPEVLAVPTTINECGSMDFMHDQLDDGRSYRA